MSIICTYTVPVAAELPFEELSRPLADFKFGPVEHASTVHRPANVSRSGNATNTNSSETLVRQPSNSSTPTNLSRNVAIRFNNDVLPRLQALFPQFSVKALIDSTATSAGDARRYSMAQLQYLIYALTNNLAGLNDAVPLTVIHEYLKEPMIAMLEASSSSGAALRSLTSMPCAAPMAETIFRCAIEAGDCNTVRRLLECPALGYDVNGGVCHSSRTPLERAAELQHLALIKQLWDLGADVNKFSNEHATRWRNGKKALSPLGAMEIALETVATTQYASTEVIATFLKAGGMVRPKFFKKRALRKGWSPQAW